MVNFNWRANLVTCYLLSFISVLRRRQARRVPRRCAITSRTWWNGLSKWSSGSSQTSQSSQTRDDHMDTLPGWSQTTRATEGIWMVWIELSGRRWSWKKNNNTTAKMFAPKFKFSDLDRVWATGEIYHHNETNDHRCFLRFSRWWNYRLSAEILQLNNKANTK